MPVDFSSPATIKEAITAGRLAVTRVEIFTPVHLTAGQNTHTVLVADVNGVEPHEEHYIETMSDPIVDNEWDALDAQGSEDGTQNDVRNVYVDFVDDSGREYRAVRVPVQAFVDGEGGAAVVAAHNAIKVLAYSDTARAAAGLPTGGSVS